MSNIIQFTPGKQISKEKTTPKVPAVHYLAVVYVMEAASMYVRNREMDKAQILIEAAACFDHADTTCQLDNTQWRLVMETL